MGYLGFGEKFRKDFIHEDRDTGRESPAVFKHYEKYFLLTSGCTGWSPNAAQYAVATNIFGPWEPRENPCVGPNSDTTFLSQNTFVLPVADKKDGYIVLFDRWNPNDLRHSGYVWLPLEIQEETVTIAWKASWDLSIFD